MMESAKKRSPLAEVERETWDEAMDWMRERLEKKLQAMADRDSAISPPQRAGVGSQASETDSSEDRRRRGGD